MPHPAVSHPSLAAAGLGHLCVAPDPADAAIVAEAESQTRVIPFPGAPLAPVDPTPPPAAALAVARRRERGQTTAEYALVLVGAATIAMLVVAWAGSTSRISGLFDTVIRSVTSLLA